MDDPGRAENQKRATYRVPDMSPTLRGHSGSARMAGLEILRPHGVQPRLGSGSGSPLRGPGMTGPTWTVRRVAVAIAPVVSLRDKHEADRFCPVRRGFGRSIA